MGSKRSTLTITVSVGAQTILLNTIPSDALHACFEASSNGVDGDGGTIGLFQANVTDTGIGTVRKQIGSNLTVTGVGQDFDEGGDFLGDHLFIVFTAGTSTTGTIDIKITQKG